MLLGVKNQKRIYSEPSKSFKGHSNEAIHTTKLTNCHLVEIKSKNIQSGNIFFPPPPNFTFLVQIFFSLSQLTMLNIHFSPILSNWLHFRYLDRKKNCSQVLRIATKFKLHQFFCVVINQIVGCGRKKYPWKVFFHKILFYFNTSLSQ